MRKLVTTIIAVVLLAIVLAGCATNTAVKEQIQMKAVEHAAVFEEIKDGASAAGFSFLTVRATLKTVKEGFYPLEPRNSLHGKPEYPFVFNIGGQGVVWLATGLSDKQPESIDGKRNPEGGEGIKYTLKKQLC